jgi:hypothetical protein
MTDNEDSKDIKPLLLLSNEKTAKKRPRILPNETFTSKTQNALKLKINIKLIDLNGTIWDFAGISTKEPIYKTVMKPYVERSGLIFNVSSIKMLNRN